MVNKCGFGGVDFGWHLSKDVCVSMVCWRSTVEDLTTPKYTPFLSREDSGLCTYTYLQHYDMCTSNAVIHNSILLKIQAPHSTL